MWRRIRWRRAHAATGGAPRDPRPGRRRTDSDAPRIRRTADRRQPVLVVCPRNGFTLHRRGRQDWNTLDFLAPTEGIRIWPAEAEL